MDKKSFILYTEQKEIIKKLSNEQAGKLIKAVYEYADNMTMPDLDSMTDLVFTMVKQDIDRNDEKYKKIIEKRREAGKKGGAPKGNKNAQKEETSKNKQNKQKQTKQADNDNVNVNDNVNDNDNNSNVIINNKNTMRKAEALALFERLWKLYPNKKGKGQVSETQKKRLLTIGEPALVKAIERYKAALLQDGGWRKPQYGSTFFNSGYVDYLDGNFEQYDQNSLNVGEAANIGEYESEWDRRVREAKERGETTPDIGPLDF